MGSTGTPHVNLATALRLGRVSNLPTVWSNVLAGSALAGAATGVSVFCAMLAASAFYVGGMYLNDAFDRDIDSRERPERPIPSGAISAKSVFAIGFGLLAEMAKRAGLPWDVILCAETFNKYKPHPDTYRGVATTFDLEPNRVMLAAAHHSDLEAARNCGLETAYIERPWEYGREQPKSVAPWDKNTLHAKSIVDLAGQLGC